MGPTGVSLKAFAPDARGGVITLLALGLPVLAVSRPEPSNSPRS
jgi:hypothetical protein